MINAMSPGAAGFDATGRPSPIYSGSTPAQSLGAVLRQRREAMGVSLAEVEVATRIRQKYLAAIEADEWHLLPGEVVGRGFLRNYSDYLGLESHEVIDRRRAVTDPGLAAALSRTSSGATLPPERQVDYRPKEVELKDDVESIQRGDIRLTPVLSIVLLALFVVAGLWAITRMRDPLANAYSGMQAQVDKIISRDMPTATPALIGIVNAQNSVRKLGVEESSGVTAESGGLPSNAGSEPSDSSGGESPAAVLLLPTATPTTENAAVIMPTATETAVAPIPTDTPVPPPATDTPIPTPTPLPTDTPIPPTPEPLEPTNTPEPPPPAVVAAACADGRSVITSPGVNQVVSGVLSIAGSANHEALDYYKLEFAPGANASDGFVYFDGRSNGVAGAALGSIDTRNLPNGEYTLRVTVVDQTGNFPPPCTVSVVVQN